MRSNNVSSFLLGVLSGAAVVLDAAAQPRVVVVSQPRRSPYNDAFIARHRRELDDAILTARHECEDKVVRIQSRRYRMPHDERNILDARQRFERQVANAVEIYALRTGDHSVSIHDFI